MASMERQAVAGPRTPLLIQSAGRAAVKHSFPLNYVLQPWDLGREFYQAFRFGIVQFVRVYVTLRLSFKLCCTVWVIEGIWDAVWYTSLR